MGPSEVQDQVDIPVPREWQENPAAGDPLEVKDLTATLVAQEQLEREEALDRLVHPETKAPQEGMERPAPLVLMDLLAHRVAE